MVKPEATGLYQNAQAYIMYYRIHPYSAFWHLVSHLGEAIMQVLGMEYLAECTLGLCSLTYRSYGNPLSRAL